MIDKLKLINKGVTFKDKLNILNYFLTRKMNKCFFRISKNSIFKVREGKPNDLFMGMEYDKEFFKYVKEKGFKRIIDIGANIGKYSLLFSENKGSQVIAFEPVKKNFIALLENIKINSSNNINPVNLACYNYNGKIEINLCKENEGGHSIVNKNNDYKKEKIKIKRLDDFLKEKDFIPDLIKIDVEGVELEVLRGSINIIRKYKPTIYLEISRKKEEIFKLLNSEGYKLKEFFGGNFLAEIKQKKEK